MLQFRDIKQHTESELTRLFPKITIKPFIKKSTPLQPIFRVITCPTLSPVTFKASLQSIQKPTVESLQQLHETLKHTEQYFTACINILEHNERVRQKYEVLLEGEEREKEIEMREVKEMVRSAGTVGCKSALVEFAEQKGHIVMGCQTKKPSSSSSPTKSKTPQTSSQLKQLYLPTNPDQYSFITTIDQDQYLRYHQQTLQKLLIQLTTINKLNRQLVQQMVQAQKSSQLPASLGQSLRQLLAELSTDEMFRVQDNKYSQVVKYLLGVVYEQEKVIERTKSDVERWKLEVRDAFVRVFYLQFIVRRELTVIKDDVVRRIDTSKQHLTSVTNQKHHESTSLPNTNPQSLTPFFHQLKNISDYLCDKEQRIFKQLYSRKITKAILAVNELRTVLCVGSKIEKRLMGLVEKEEKQETEGERENREKEEELMGQKLITEKLQQNILQQQIHAFLDQLSVAQKQTHDFTKSITSKTKPSNANQHQILENNFIKLFRKLQQLQLLFSTLYSRQKSSSGIRIKHQLTDKVKSHILGIETGLISKFRHYAQIQGVTLFQNYTYHPDSLVDDDKLSHFSEVSAAISTQSSIFAPRKLQLSDVLLQTPSQSIDMTKFPTLSIDQLIAACNQFISDSFINNSSLANQLEDFNHFNFPQIFHFLNQINTQSQSLIKFNLKPVQQQPQLNTPNKNLQPEPQKPSQSPQKGKQKGRLSKQKSPVKQATKSPPIKSPSKLPEKQQNPQNPIQSPQTLKQDILALLKAKLLFIKQILIPSISQSRVSRIFEQNFQSQIFERLSMELNRYRSRICGQNLLLEGQKYGFGAFVSSRSKFILTITKNIAELREIFQFVRVFSDQKVRLEASEDQTYDLVLRALLAQKQIQAYRRENADLAQANKLSVQGIRFLQTQIYLPFLHMFKHLLKIVSTDDMVLKGLQGMLESVRCAIDARERIMTLVQQVDEDKRTFLQLQQKILHIVSMYESIKKYPILRFKKLQSMIRRLRHSLTLQSKSKNQNKMQTIKKYLKEKLQQPQQQQILS